MVPGGKGGWYFNGGLFPGGRARSILLSALLIPNTNKVTRFCQGSAIQRIERFNTTFLVNISGPPEGGPLQTSRGTLLLVPAFWVPPHMRNLLGCHGAGLVSGWTARRGGVRVIKCFSLASSDKLS